MKRFKKILRITGLVLAVLLVITGIFYCVVYIDVQGRMDKQYSFGLPQLNLPSDSASIADGAHIAKIRGCQACHGEDFSGKVMMDEPLIGQVISPNITRGMGGLPAGYSAADWLRSLRHGVGHNGRPLIIMPSHETALMTKGDLEKLIAYCQQLPGVDKTWPASKPGPVLRTMDYLGKMNLLPVETIDHNAALAELPDSTNSIATGKYLSVTCQGCHYATMKGGESPIPGFPPVPDISATGAAGQWTYNQFRQLLKTGIRPDKRQVDNESMPWQMTAHFSEKEIRALYDYLRSVN